MALNVLDTQTGLGRGELERNIMRWFLVFALLLIAGCQEGPLKFGDKITITASLQNKAAPNWRIYKTATTEDELKDKPFPVGDELIAFLQAEHFRDIAGSQTAIFRSQGPRYIEIEVTAKGAGNGNKARIGFVNLSDVTVTREK